MWDRSSLTRDRTCILYAGRWSLNYRTTREMPLSWFKRHKSAWMLCSFLNAYHVSGTVLNIWYVTGSNEDRNLCSSWGRQAEKLNQRKNRADRDKGNGGKLKIKQARVRGLPSYLRSLMEMRVLGRGGYEGLGFLGMSMRETRVRSLGQEDALEKKMATHSSILAWKIPWTEEPGGL